MNTTHSGLAVYYWTLRRHWASLAIFIAATGLMIFCLMYIYPEIAELQSDAIAEAFGGDIKLSLRQDGDEADSYVLQWEKLESADGYVVVESEMELPLALAKGMAVPNVDVRLMASLVPSVGKMFVHELDASTSELAVAGLDDKYGEKDALVYFAVLAFRTEGGQSIFEAASQSVNTRNMVAEGPFDKLMQHPLIQSFVGTENLDIYSIKGFLCLELFNGLTLYLIIFFLILYAGAFCSDVEGKTIDLVLSTPLTRRSLFISRYLAWVSMNLVFVLSWIVLIYLGVMLIGKQEEVALGDVARTMISFLPLLLAVQGYCMVASLVTNQTMKAYGICFGVYYGTGILEMIGTLSEQFSALKYVSLTYYWDFDIIFIDGVIPWRPVLILIAVATVFFLVGLWLIQRKDMAS